MIDTYQIYLQLFFFLILSKKIEIICMMDRDIDISFRLQWQKMKNKEEFINNTMF